MADTFSSNLKVRLLETGAYNNVWGAVHNSDAINLLDLAIAGRSTIALGVATTYSLQALTDGGASESRSAILTFTGTPASLVTVTVPATVSGTKIYIVDNQTAQTIRIGYASGAFVDVAAGTRRIIECDAAIPGVFAIFSSASDASTLGGVVAANYARLDIANVFQKRNSSAFITVTEAPTTTIDAALGNHQILTLTGNRTMAVPSNPVDGEELFLVVQQDGTGSRTLTWNAVFIFENGSAPILATTPGALDFFVMIYNTALTKWIVGHFANVSAAGGAQFQYTIAENTVDWNLLARVGSLGGPVTVNITISQGVMVQATCPGTPAMDLSGLPVSSTINIFNSGYVLGKGGQAGDGGSFARAVADIGPVVGGTSGRPGGNAIKGVGSGITLNITNAAGHIWGGGGGGGGGGFTTPGGTVEAAGGGGGGGAGGGGAGSGGMGSLAGGSTRGVNGVDGSTGPLGTFGTGGAGATNGATGYAGGSGGDWGAAGAAGAGATPTDGAGGTAGKAIELNGGTANFISGSGSPNVKGAVS